MYYTQEVQKPDWGRKGRKKKRKKKKPEENWEESVKMK
jgi:hypothetical protein